MSAQVSHTRYRMLPSTKIAIGFVIVAALGYFGLRFWSSQMIDGYEFKQIKPGRLNIVGVDVGKGYRIVVQNRVAVLEMGQGADFDSPDIDVNAEPGEEIGGKRRVPIKELLASLQGDTTALGRFVMIMNEIKESEFPPVRVDWAAEDIERALAGDAQLVEKLQNDLGVDLKGRPLPKLRINALLNGIIVHSPVQVRVSIEGKEQLLTATIMRPFRSRFGGSVEAELKEKKVRDNDKAALQSIVIDQAAIAAGDPTQLENVAQNLRYLIDKEGLQRYAAPAEKVLRSATVIVSDAHITDASYTMTSSDEGEQFFTLKLILNDEGRKQLWKYSKEHIGDQLLVVKDGVAIAAPLVRSELANSDVDVTQLQEEILVKETVELVKQLREGTRVK